jgi:hypothetical protein
VDLVLPGTAAGLCVVLAWSMLRRFVARRRFHELIWGVTFGAFGLAAGAEAYASLFGWTPALVRLYYLAGASLSVGLLALGTLVLLVPRRIALVALGVVLVQSAFMVFLVLRSPVDPDVIRTAGWSALGRDGSLRALALTINVLGTLIVLLGTFGSSYAQWANGNGARAFGVFLIGLGTLTVAAGGSLTRFGHHLLYGPMVLGLLIIFAGYRRVAGPSGHAPITSAPRTAAAEPETAPTDATIRGDAIDVREAWPSHARSSPPPLSKEASDR